MPTYTVTDPQTKKSVKLTGDSPPTEAELNTIFAQIHGGAQSPKPTTADDEAALSLAAAAGGGYSPMTAKAMGQTVGGNMTPGNVAMAAGTAASVATGGLAVLPAAALVGGSAAAGSLLGSGVQAASGRPTSLAAAGASALENGAVNAIGEGVGRGAASVANAGARYLMNRAANVTDRLAREFPNLSQTLIDNAIAVSQGGYGKARSMLMAAKADANAALGMATKAGAKIPIQLTPDLADSLKTVMIENAMKTGQASSQSAGQPLTVATERLAPKVQVFLNTVDAALKNNQPITLTPEEADTFKTQLQRESKNLYAAMRGPNGTPAIGQSAALKAEFASTLNDAIDGVASGYKTANAKAREMIGATRAIQQAIRPGKNLYMAMVRPTTGALAGSLAGETQGHPGAGAVLGAAASTPTGMSYEALTLAHPVVQTLLRQLPRGFASALSAYLQQAPAERTSPQP